MCWTGTHLVVADGDGFGSLNYPNPPTTTYNGNVIDPRRRYARVLDTSTEMPTLFKSIDLQPYEPFSNSLNAKLSFDGTMVFLCLRCNNYVTGLGSNTGFVIILDSTTFNTIGVCQMTGGNIGPLSDKATGARDCVDDGAGHLYVTNSNADITNWIEKFDIATAISNGPNVWTPSTLKISCDHHAEELCFDGTYIWTTGWEYSRAMQRLDPGTDTISSCTPTSGGFPFGMSYFFGHLWSLDYNGILQRIDPSLFVPGGSNSMVAESINLTGLGTAKNCITSDGTHLWVAAQNSTSPGQYTAWKIDPTPGSLAIVATTTVQYPGDTNSNFSGPYHMGFDGTFIWGAIRNRRSTDSTPTGQPSVLTKINPATNAEILQWAGPPRSVWLGNKDSAILYKISTADPTNPTIVATIDLSAYGTGIKRVRVNRDYRPDAAAPGGAGFHSNHVYVAMWGSPPVFVIVDASTDQVVGVGSANPTYSAIASTDFAFGADGSGRFDGTVYVIGQSFDVNGCRIIKYIWRDIIDAFPATYSSPIAQLQTGHFIENLTFGFGKLWGTSDWQHTPGVIYQIDPDLLGTITTYTDSNGTGKYHSCLYAFGSLWVTGANSSNANKIFRFDPNTFPAAPIASVVVDPTNTVSNTCEMCADDTTIWVTNGSNFVSNLPYLYRVSTVLGSEALIASVTIPSTNSSTQSVAFDGDNVWAALRYGTSVGLVSVSTGLGTEAPLCPLFNPGAVFTDPHAVDTD